MPDKKPICRVRSSKSANVTVPVYAATTRIKGKAYPAYLVRYKLDGQKKPIQEKRASLDKAKAIAKKAADAIAAGQTAQLGIDNADAATWHKIKTACAKIGKSPELVFSEYEHAFMRIRQSGVTIETCVVDYLTRQPREIVAATIGELLPAYLTTKSGFSRKHRRDWKNRLDSAAAFFTGPIHQVTTEDFQAWLDGMKHHKTREPLSAQSRVNFLACLQDFYRSNVAKKHLPKDWNAIEQVKRPVVVKKKVDVFTVEEMTTLLYSAAGYITLPNATDEQRQKLREIVPFLAIGAFGFTRNSTDDGEITELDWSKIDLQNNEIDMDEGTAKVKDRYIPILPNLRAWLLPFAQSSGPVIPSHVARTRPLLCQLTGIAWKWNVLRRSCISYSLASTKNVEKVSADAGNSPAMIYSRYRKALRPELGERWFAIMPPDTANIVPLTSEQKAVTKPLQKVN